MSGSKDGSGRGLVTTTRLDTNESVLDNIDTSDTVPSRKSIEGEEDLDRVGDALAVGRVGHLDGQTLLELDVNLLRLFGRLLRRGGELPHVIGRRLVGVLEDTSFVRDVEKVLVGGPRLGSSLDDGNTVLSGIF